MIDLPILYRDLHYIILNKPAGLKVHAGPGGGMSVEDFLPRLSKRDDGPWLAHRLDAETAGCLLVALRKQPLIAAQKAFAEGRVRKAYWAVVVGGPAEDEGQISAPLAKLGSVDGWKIAVRADGADALSSYRVLGRSGGLSWLELVPHTGRTHQLRVHCAHAGFPMFGDSLYGEAAQGLHLMSRALGLPDTQVSAEAPPPGHMVRALKACGFAGS